VTSSRCPDCGHAWKNHNGSSIHIYACLECAIEEEQGDRDLAAICSRVPPGAATVPAGDSLTARYRRGLLRGDGVAIEDRSGQPWALLRPQNRSRQGLERLLRQVQEDLATMPIIQFREKYQALKK
jgi:hypothetical protein